MPRVPKFSTSTSGQGVSRKAYQVGRALGNRGSASPGGGVGQSLVPRSLPQPPAGSSGGIASGSRSYPKAGPVSSQYGPPVMDPNNLSAVAGLGKAALGKATQPSPRPPRSTKGFSF